jgi:hypothetical protein
LELHVEQRHELEDDVRVLRRTQHLAEAHRRARRRRHSDVLAHLGRAESLRVEDRAPDAHGDLGEHQRDGGAGGEQ